MTFTLDLRPASLTIRGILSQGFAIFLACRDTAGLTYYSTMQENEMDSNNDDVFLSFGRCTLKKDFFEDFYNDFINRSPEIKTMFTNTNMTKQRQLLKDGISYMIMFAKKSATGTAKMEQIAQLHDRQHFNVRPELYALWLDALLDTVKRHDPQYTPEISKSWIATMNMGLDLFKKQY